MFVNNVIYYYVYRTACGYFVREIEIEISVESSIMLAFHPTLG